MSKDDILSSKVQQAISLNGQTANVENMMSLAEQMGMNHQFIGNEVSLENVNLGLQVRPDNVSPAQETIALSKGNTGGLTSPATPVGDPNLIVDGPTLGTSA